MGWTNSHRAAFAQKRAALTALCTAFGRDERILYWTMKLSDEQPRASGHHKQNEGVEVQTKYYPVRFKH